MLSGLIMMYVTVSPTGLEKIVPSRPIEAAVILNVRAALELDLTSVLNASIMQPATSTDTVFVSQCGVVTTVQTGTFHVTQSAAHVTAH
jgi:hypothetical protein